MKKIGFIGGFDKLDIVLYTAVIIRQMGGKCLIVDSTQMQKSKYIFHTIENMENRRYVTTVENVDVAVGYYSFQELEQDGIFNIASIHANDVDPSTGDPINVRTEKYDFIFVDIDNIDTLNSFNFTPDDLIFLCTAFDAYSLNKGIEIMEKMDQTKVINRILFGKKITKNHLAYIRYACQNQNINWGKINITFPYDNGDWTIIFENQRENRFNLKPFSKPFKKALRTLVQVISEQGMMGVNSSMNFIEKS